ncbi:hypothetical protein HDV06_003500 [Boothiomyces sp. JEL0866]|nr:hypothetical protein HDV06_003469 [Boothiomyces sp. JEL0866]KAJ3325730.1 hypothetical protein HDV06_003500 [Boothiomyces sp. JEL0866]
MVGIVIVLDTNYLLDHCTFIEQLLSVLTDNFIMYIPYIVIQELDGLKLNPSKIASQLSPYIVLLSNDKNLCVKAAVHGIRTFSTYLKSPKELLDEITGNQTERKSMDMSVENENFSENEMELDSSGDELYLILTDLNATLVGCLSATLKKLFIQKYSLEWEEKTKRYPWTLSDIVHLLNSQIFLLNLMDSDTKSNLNYFKRFALDLERSLRREKSMFTKGDITRFIEQISAVLVLCEHAEFLNDKLQATEILSNLKIKVNEL